MFDSHVFYHTISICEYGFVLGSKGAKWGAKVRITPQEYEICAINEWGYLDQFALYSGTQNACFTSAADVVCTDYSTLPLFTKYSVQQTNFPFAQYDRKSPSRISLFLLTFGLMVVRTSVSSASSVIITCASSKGGVGKSTACACLAGAFAHLGETVHIADLDANRTVSRWFQDSKTRPREITVSNPDPQNLTEHLQEIGRQIAPDFIMIDVAGAYERALTVAAARAHLTIIPTTLSEADVYEAEKTAQHIQQIFASFGREPLARLLLTKVQPLTSLGQRHAALEIKRKQLPLLASMLAQRAAYEEIGLSGLPPHYADASRETVAKAVTELNALRDEILLLVKKRQPKAPALAAAAGAA